MKKYTPNHLGKRSLEIIRSYLPNVRVLWLKNAGSYAIQNPTLSLMDRIFFIDMAPSELKTHELAFYITHLSGGRFNYNALKREIAHGESKRQARARQSAEDGKELRREVAHW